MKLVHSSKKTASVQSDLNLKIMTPNFSVAVWTTSLLAGKAKVDKKYTDQSSPKINIIAITTT